MCKRVGKKQTKTHRNWALKIIQKIQKEFKNSKEFKFNFRLVGSGKWALIVKDTNNDFDLDYQIIITKNFKNYTPSQIRKKFYSAFSKVICNKSVKVEDSTSVITIKTSNNCSYDFAILEIKKDGLYIIRRNNKNTINEYTLNKLKPFDKDILNTFKKLDSETKNKILNKTIKMKCIEKQKQNKNERQSSTSIFFNNIKQISSKFKI